MARRGCAAVGWVVALAACDAGAPRARLAVPWAVALGQEFTADGRGSEDGWQRVERYRWDFGDGSPALITASPVQGHRYGAPGSYTVKLRVEDGAGRTGQDEASVEVAGGEAGAQAAIAVDACRDRGILDCAVGFGGAVVGREATRQVRITNTGAALLRLRSVALDAGAPASLRVSEPGAGILRAGESTQVTLAWLPVWEGEQAAVLRVVSNAANLEADQRDVAIPVAGSATAAPAPRLAVEPPECVFGDIQPGQRATCDVTLRSEGAAPLTLASVGLSADTDPLITLSRDAGELPARLEPGGAVMVQVTFAPTVDGIYVGTLVVGCDDPRQPVVEVPLWGTANTPLPAAAGRVATVNGEDAGGGVRRVVRPLDDVVVSGVDSRASEPGAEVVSYQWTLVERPGTSTVRLITPSAVETGFSFNSNGVDRRGLDVVGSFTVELKVTDSLGRRSVNRARVVLDTVPANALHVQLTWEDPRADMDLHLMRGDGSAFSVTEDCYYANCVAGTDAAVHWGGDDTSPKLEVDDVDGYGPENSGIWEPAPGRYTIAVHFYDPHGDNQDIPVRLRIYVRGVLAGDFQVRLVCCNALWTAARVEWSDTPEVTQVNAFEQTQFGSCSTQPPPGLACTF